MLPFGSYGNQGGISEMNNYIPFERFPQSNPFIPSVFNQYDPIKSAYEYRRMVDEILMKNILEPKVIC